ncbi:MAG: hypothetical protein AAF636_16420 [Pseudomonadota bacterium]
MIVRMSGAVLRGLMVALLIATPALMLPDVARAQSQIVVLVALVAALLTTVEYHSNAPSIVEFRDAGPFNRMRFAALFVTVFFLSAVLKGKTDPTVLNQALTAIGTILGHAIDFPYSPVRLVVLMLPQDVSVEMVRDVRTAAGISYAVSLFAMVVFVAMVRIGGWPIQKGAFNVWVNLPLFDPTTGGDVLRRLYRDARWNIAIGFLLPFVIPALVKSISHLINPVTLENPQTMIWTITAWAFLPASMIMRGIALQRVAELIEMKRRAANRDTAEEVDYQAA